MSLPAISLRDVHFSYPSASGGRIPVLHGISLDVAHGELVAILGPSGCGKSSLLSLVPGLLKPDQGTVEVHNSLSQGTQTQQSIGMVFQDPVLFPWRTAYENIALPLEIAAGDGPFRPSNGEMRHRVEAALSKVKLSGFESSYPDQLSGGMQARVAIARALVTSPDVVIMDEPFASLDDITRSALNFGLLEIKQATEAAILFVTHSMSEAVLLADRVIMLSRRPGSVLLDLKVDFASTPRNENLTESPQFLEYVRKLRAALKMAAA